MLGPSENKHMHCQVPGVPKPGLIQVRFTFLMLK
jgi:hypothetical protein